MFLFLQISSDEPESSPLEPSSFQTALAEGIFVPKPSYHTAQNAGDTHTGFPGKVYVCHPDPIFHYWISPFTLSCALAWTINVIVSLTRRKTWRWELDGALVGDCSLPFLFSASWPMLTLPSFKGKISFFFLWEFWLCPFFISGRSVILRTVVRVYFKYAFNCPSTSSSIQILISELEKINVNMTSPNSNKTNTRPEPKSLVYRSLHPMLVLFRATSGPESPRFPFRVKTQTTAVALETLPSEPASRDFARLTPSLTCNLD